MATNFIIIFSLWWFLSWGLTSIIVQSRLLSSIRDWFIVHYPMIGYMLECYQCMGFWIGGLLSLYMPLEYIGGFSLVVFTPAITNFIFWGIISSGICFIVRNLISKSSE